MTSDCGIRALEELARPETLELIHELLAGVFVDFSIDEREAMQFELAVVEIGANIIEHSRAGGEVSLRLEVEVAADRIEARYFDDGNPVRVDLDAVSLPDDFAERGRGLAIAVSVVDEIVYRRADGKNYWRLVRNR